MVIRLLFELNKYLPLSLIFSYLIDFMALNISSIFFGA